MFDPTANDTYALRHRAEILAILERLRHERTLTTVEFGDGHAIVSSVLALRSEANAIVFDIARDPELNRSLFAAARLSFVTELDHIQIAFETPAASLVAMADGPAAVVELPTSVIRLQRREWFRVSLPVDAQLPCTVLDAHGNANPARAVDLSPGGAALVLDRVAAHLGEPGADHELILSLPDVGRVEIDATLSNIMPNATPHAGQAGTIRAGFRFVGVPPKTASQIQRFVNKVEVMRRRT